MVPASTHREEEMEPHSLQGCIGIGSQQVHIETREVDTRQKDKYFPHEESQAVAWTDCVFSVLGFQNGAG